LILPLLLTSILDKKETKIIEIGHNKKTIRILRSKTNKIEKVPFEEYIVGVLAGEMPLYFKEEALKAQAVASRSYALKRMEYNKNKSYDVVDNTNNQVYLDNEYLKKAWGTNYTTNINKLRKIVNATSCEYLDYNGAVVDAFFFSTSTGKTEDAKDVFNVSLPYLKSVSSTWDEKVSPVFYDYYTFSLDNFYKKLGLSKDENIKIEVTNVSGAGRIKNIKINNVNFTGSKISSIFGLRSTSFIIKKEGNNINITTNGFGHGVGMSQYGAEGMAIEGYKYDEILKHYYSGVKIKKYKY
jgi:stage II sporulation protein D